MQKSDTYSIPKGCLERIQGKENWTITIQRGDFGILRYDESLIIRELVSGFATSEIGRALEKRGIISHEERMSGRFERPGFIQDFLSKLKKKTPPLYYRIQNWLPAMEDNHEYLSFEKFWLKNEYFESSKIKNILDRPDVTADNIKLRVIIYLREVFRFYQPINIDKESFFEK